MEPTPKTVLKTRWWIATAIRAFSALGILWSLESALSVLPVLWIQQDVMNSLGPALRDAGAGLPPGSVRAMLIVAAIPIVLRTIVCSMLLAFAAPIAGWIARLPKPTCSRCTGELTHAGAACAHCGHRATPAPTIPGFESAQFSR